MNLEERIKEKIESSHLKPKSKWNFILKNWGIWALGVVTITVGAVCFSVIIFIFKNIKFEFYHITHDSFLSFFLEFAPSLWIVSLIFFVYLADVLLKKTNRGYRYNIFVISSTVVVLSVVLGGVFYQIGFGQLMDDVLDSNIPFYKSVNLRNKEIWSNPEQGFLFGEIIREQDIKIKTFNGDFWVLDVTDLSDDSNELLENGEQVRIIGQKLGDKVFYTCLVIPFEKGNPIAYKNKISERMGIIGEILENERNEKSVRSIRCKGVRPYERLQN